MTQPKTTETPLAKLTPAPWNPRTIRDERFKNLCASIDADPEFLWRRPVLAMLDGTIYAGNMRYRAAAHLGRKSIPAIVEDVPEQLAKERALRDNAQWGDWNDDQLAEMVYQMAASGSDVKLLGIEEDELARLLGLTGADGTEGLTDPDEVPENVPTRSKRGDLWLLGEHRVLCGDATSAEDVARVLGGAAPNLMVTDPPYGVEYDPEWREEYDQFERHSTGLVANDNRDDWREAWALFPGDVAYAWHAGLRATAHAESLLSVGFEVRAQIIWVKQHFAFGRGHYHFQHEPCWYAVKRGGVAGWAGDRKQTTVWEIANKNPMGGKEDDANTEHSTQKPIECMARPIRNHKGDVYDPFLGSGTTLIACEQLGRKCYGLEIEPKYVDVILQRWENFTGNTAVLDGRG